MPREVREVDVAVIKSRIAPKRVIDMHSLTRYLTLLSLLVVVPIQAAVLPEDRADILYHSYDGGGVTIDGPSVLVRKQFAGKVSLWANYYVDMVSSASIDVVTSASTDGYTEERTETSTGFDYLYDRTTMSFSYTSSEENDYSAKTYGFALSQDFFGDMTTLSMNYSQGNDEVRQNIYENGAIVSSDFQGNATRQRFGVGLTQVLTKNWILALNLEAVIDEGFLRNPYRTIRFRNGDDIGRSLERYPSTRNSDALALRSMYYLPYRAALRTELRAFADSWGVNSQNIEFRYLQPYKENVTFELKFRYYDQNQANFYSDLFPFEDAQTFLARDKELSDFNSLNLGFGASYDLPKNWLPFFEKTSAHLFYDRIRFEYGNFRDISGTNTAIFGIGNEPLYRFDANVIRLFISAWF